MILLGTAFIGFVVGVLFLCWLAGALVLGFYAHMAAHVPLIRATLWWLRWPWIYGRDWVRSWK